MVIAMDEHLRLSREQFRQYAEMPRAQPHRPPASSVAHTGGNAVFEKWSNSHIKSGNIEAPVERNTARSWRCGAFDLEKSQLIDRLAIQGLEPGRSGVTTGFRQRQVP